MACSAPGRFCGLLLAVVTLAAAGYDEPTDVIIPADGSEACPEGFISIKDSCYWLSEEKASFMDCQEYVCGPMNSTLAFINDTNTSEVLLEAVQHNSTSKRAWVGLYEVGPDESGEWAWISGATSYNVTALWAEGEPNEWCNANEDCAMLQAGGLNDAVCIFKANCLCEAGGNYTTEEYNGSIPNLTSAPAEHGPNTCVKRISPSGAVFCFWYWDTPFQVVWFLLAMPSFGVMAWVVACTVGSTVGVRTIKKYRVADHDMLAPSPYGRLLDIPSGGPNFDGLVGFWVTRAAKGEILYALFLGGLAFTLMLHVKGKHLGYWIDAVEALAMAVCKLMVGLCACAVRCHLSPTACAVAGPWLPALAASKVLMAVCALSLSLLYACIQAWGKRAFKKNCSSVYFFSWSLLFALVLQSTSGFALFKIHERAVGFMGEVSLFSRVVGPWWMIFVASTFASGAALGIVCALFVFDDPYDNIDPFAFIGAMFLVAASAQFVNGVSLISASKRVEAYITSSEGRNGEPGGGGRTMASVEMMPA